MNTTFGRYRLLERLGQGGMAEVFKAKSYGVEGFEKVVVIKRILQELASSPQFVDMFIHEAKLAVRLSHANIVQVFDLGIAPGGVVGSMPQRDAYYMAMEYVSGFDLATLLARCRRQQVQIPIEMAVYVAAEVAKGLDHAHRRRDEQNQPLNVVHRDVSPQNILLSLEGEVKVTDFGIAKARGALEGSLEDTRARKLQGKFGYMSPEHAAGEAVDARSDLFSLGTVLYEMLAGVNPFSAPTSFETLRRVSASEYPPVELLRPEVPAELVNLLRTAMAPSMDQRFADAGRMYEALLVFLYAQGRRFGAHDLAAFLGRFHEPEQAPESVVLDADAGPSRDQTPVEVPATRRSYPVSQNKLPSGIPQPLPVDVEQAASLGERREVTALVVELPGDRSSSDVARAQATVDERAAETITRHGGLLVARGPEQITALFGLEEPDGRDTEIATRCALVLLRALAGARQPSAGLHVGRIHVSADGTPTDDERLASLISVARDLARAREGMCAISAPAMRLVRNLFVFDTLGGEHDPARPGPSAITTLLVTDVRAASEAVGRFIGRKEELRVVGEVLAMATRRTAAALTIRGEHGVGKSRLLVEVERRLRKGGYNIGFYQATCLPRGTGLPLSGIQCMLQTLCGISEGDPESRIQQVSPRLRALGLQEDEVSAVLSLLGASRSGAKTSTKSALVNAFTRMVQRLSEDRPHVFSWDAAHCMDAESFAMLETVLTRLPSARAVFVLATRAGFSHALEKLGSPGGKLGAPDARHFSIDLTDLAEDDAERLVAARLGVGRVPAELVRFVRDRAAGHPQMTEEIVKALLEARAVTVADAAVVSMKLVGQDLSLPKTLRGLVASRIAHLATAPRGVLQAAAVLGEPIAVPVLARMTALDIQALERLTATLVDHAFLVYTGPLELRFTSPIIREVVVDALTSESKAAMHAAAGLALEEAGDDRAVEHPSRIATHLYASGESERAGAWFSKSGERRLESGQLEAAAVDFTRAIELCDAATCPADVMARWLSGLATAVSLVRSLPEATAICERVIASVDERTRSDAPDAASLALRVRVRIDAGRILGALNAFDAARAQFAAAEVIAGSHHDLVKSTLVAAAELAGVQGDFKRSLQFLERQRPLVTTESDPVEQHKLAISLSQTHAAMSDHASALRHFETACQLSPTDPTFACERHKLRGIIDYFARDFRAAALNFEKAIDRSRELGLSYEVALNLHNLGDALVQLADYPRAYGAIKQSLALCEELGHERLASYDRMILAFLDGLSGDEDAESTLLQGIRYAESNDFTWDHLGGRLLLAKLLQHRREDDEARLEFQRVKELARAAEHRLVAEDCRAALVAMGGRPSELPGPP